MHSAPFFYRCNHASSLGVRLFSPLVSAGADYLSAGGAVGGAIADSATSECNSSDLYADGDGDSDHDRHAYQHADGNGDTD